MAIKVRFREAAVTDLLNLYAYIAEQSGRSRAGSSIDRIEAARHRLVDYPERGIRRDDIRPTQTFTSLLTFKIGSSIDFASKKPNQSWLPPRKAA